MSPVSFEERHKEKEKTAQAEPKVAKGVTTVTNVRKAGGRSVAGRTVVADVAVGVVRAGADQRHLLAPQPRSAEWQSLLAVLQHHLATKQQLEAPKLGGCH